MREPTIIIYLKLEDNRIVSAVQNIDMIEITDEFYAEVIQIISTDGTIPNSGIIYSYKTNSFFYMNYLISGEIKSVFLFSISIVDAVSFYYLKSRIDLFIASLFEKTDNITDKIINFENYLNRINLGNKIDLHSNIFDNNLFEFILNYFEKTIDIIIYSLLLEIPIILENVSDKHEYIKEQFLKLIPELKILIIDKKNSFTNDKYHIIITDRSNTSYYRDQLVYDANTKNIVSSFDCPAIIKKLVDEAIYLHRESFIPFIHSIYVKIEWSINKIFGIIALQRSRIDFKDHLLEDELDFLAIFNKLYLKLGYNKSLLVKMNN